MPIRNTICANAKDYNTRPICWRRSAGVSRPLQTNPDISHQPGNRYKFRQFFGGIEIDRRGLHNGCTDKCQDRKYFPGT